VLTVPLNNNKPNGPVYSLPTHLRRVKNSTTAFGRSLKTHLFSEY